MSNFKNIRQIVLDTETTGMNKNGSIFLNHKIIEIGALELLNRKITGRFLHYYLQPDRLIDTKAYKIHGISNNFLKNKPRFHQIYKSIISFFNNCEIIVHNSMFDIGFLNYEMEMLNLGINSIQKFCKIFDTLDFSRKLFPGKKNSLDALCNRYKISNHDRHVHGALLDAKLLAKVYLAMTSKQEEFLFSESESHNLIKDNNFLIQSKKKFKVLYANSLEIQKHNKYLNEINKNSKNLW